MPSKAKRTSRDQSQILSVSELNKLARLQLEGQFGQVQVEGEISELLKHRSGHWYFTLKDESSQLRVAMFRFSNQRVTFNPEDGQQVQLGGKLSIYEPRGSYQFIAESMQPAGAGKLQQAFEQLKRELAASGMFDTARKRALPSLPEQIAIITSSQGAAVKDIVSTFRRRFAGIELIVVPVAVQGDTAAKEIAAAIEWINQLSIEHKSKREKLAPDAVIVGRGGGSLEDLWAFNERIVAEAIYRSELPVVSAVGHETDFTIADFVADARAATPTAAAELLSPDGDALLSQITAKQTQLRHRMAQKLAYSELLLGRTRARLQHPGAKIEQQSQALDYLDNRLQTLLKSQFSGYHQTLSLLAGRLSAQSPDHTLQNYRLRLSHSAQGLKNATGDVMRSLNQRVATLAEAMHLVSPLATLKRGYAIVQDNSNQVVRSTQQVHIGEQIQTRLADGALSCTVDKITANQQTTVD